MFHIRLTEPELIWTFRSWISLEKDQTGSVSFPSVQPGYTHWHSHALYLLCHYHLSSLLSVFVPVLASRHRFSVFTLTHSHCAVVPRPRLRPFESWGQPSTGRGHWASVSTKIWNVKLRKDSFGVTEHRGCVGYRKGRGRKTIMNGIPDLTTMEHTSC